VLIIDPLEFYIIAALGGSVASGTEREKLTDLRAI
jgi:hypothetical protein